MSKVDVSIKILFQTCNYASDLITFWNTYEVRIFLYQCKSLFVRTLHVRCIVCDRVLQAEIKRLKEAEKLKAKERAMMWKQAEEINRMKQNTKQVNNYEIQSCLLLTGALGLGFIYNRNCFGQGSDRQSPGKIFKQLLLYLHELDIGESPSDSRSTFQDPLTVLQ